MLFVINGNLNQYLRPREIYQKKYHALIGCSNCIKVEAYNLIQT